MFVAQFQIYFSETFSLNSLPLIQAAWGFPPTTSICDLLEFAG